jgi:hypothetical protein
MDLKEKDVRMWTGSGDQRLAVVNTVMNLQIP